MSFVGKDPQLHPLHILNRDQDALRNWALGEAGGEAGQVVGALAELVAAAHFGGRIVSHKLHSYDLLVGAERIEVKTARGASLSGKDCTKVVLVKLQRTHGGGIVAEGIEWRPHPDPADGKDHWVSDETFTPYEVLKASAAA